MTEALYHQDSYIQTFEATVTEVREDGVVLDRTAFYPGGGGQPNDLGTLSAGEHTWTVTKVGRKDGAVVHQLEGGAPAVGDVVTGVIDWERRHQLMRTHTALHVLCGVIWRDFGAQVTGGDMQPLAARMDFEFEHMTATFAEEVEELVNREVAEGRPISTRILPRDEAMAIPDLIRTKINLLAARHPGGACGGNRGVGPAGGRRHALGQHARRGAHPHRRPREQGPHQQATAGPDRGLRTETPLASGQAVAVHAQDSPMLTLKA